MNILEKLQAKLRLGEYRQGIREAKAVLSQSEQINLPLLNLISSKAWAISPGGLKGLASHARSSIGIEFADFFELRPETIIGADGVAVIHVHGALVDACPPIFEKLGIVTKYSTITADIADVTAKGAKKIVLVFNSPGGTVSGVKEASEAIAKSRVPITAFCSGMACSAAYHLAVGAKEIIATPSATVGNVGTILSWADESAFWDSIGVEWKALVNEGADLKSTFHLEPDAKQLAFLQGSINEAGASFRKHVEKHRPGISAEVFRAGWYSGEKAKALGLVDSIGSLAGSAASSAKHSPASSAPKAAAPAPAPAASKPAATPVQQPKLTVANVTMPQSSIPKPAPKAASNPALANIPTHELLATANGYRHTAQQRQEALNEIDSREGFFVIESTAFVEYGKYHTMGIQERYQFSQAGGRIAMRPVTAEDKKGTAAQFLAVPANKEESTLKFPGDPNTYVFPVKGSKRRSVVDFMKFSRPDIRAIGAECSTHRGTALRREIMDAVFDIPWDVERHQIMSAFQAAYSDAFRHIRSLGPEKPDTESPPETNGGMNAEQLLALSAESAASIDEQAYRPGGRRTRREVKTAYMAATASEKVALLARFPYSLKKEIHEYI